MTKGAFGALMAALWDQDWNVHLKEAFQLRALGPGIPGPLYPPGRHLQLPASWT